MKATWIFAEAGPDCEEGDKYCRTIGTAGRCFLSSGGMYGAGVRTDRVACTTNAQCNSKGYCKGGPPRGCLKNSDCSSGNCVGKCSHNGASCNGDAACGAGNTCRGVCANTPGTQCTSAADCDPGEPCAYNSADFCIPASDTTSAMRVKMCQLSLRKCQTNAQCATIPGDSCGPASSRMIVAKRALNNLIQQHNSTVNFGLMTFLQINYYPYYEIAPASVGNEVRTTYLDRAELEAATTPCFSDRDRAVRHLRAQRDDVHPGRRQQQPLSPEQGRLLRLRPTPAGAPPAPPPARSPGSGTGIYQGSYYTFNLPIGTPSSTLRTFTDYAGKTRTADGKTYYYYEVPTTIRNEGNVYADAAPDVIDSYGIPAACGDDTGAIWNGNMVPFMDTAKVLSSANAQTMSRKLSLLFDKASLGGLMSAGSTPSGCALKNEGTGAVYQRSAYHYLEKVKAENAANGVSCRPSHILFLTDGAPNGPGDIDCGHADCALDVPGPGCQCKAVTNARALYTSLGVKVYVIGFSGSRQPGATPSTVMNNIAKAGGTKQAFFAVQEAELYDALSSAIYDAVKGSYATSPIAAAAGDSYATAGSTWCWTRARTFPAGRAT